MHTDISSMNLHFGIILVRITSITCTTSAVTRIIPTICFLQADGYSHELLANLVTATNTQLNLFPFDFSSKNVPLPNVNAVLISLLNSCLLKSKYLHKLDYLNIPTIDCELDHINLCQKCQYLV